MRHFDIEMNDLQNRLLDMASLVQEMIRAATVGLSGKDLKQVEKVYSLEKKVNIQEIVVDDKCLKLIALNQPVGTDLRFITSAMRINSDLERIGDEAVSISRMAKDLVKYKELKPLEDIPNMVLAVENMVVESIKAFNTSDADLAFTILKKDDEVDKLRDKIIDDIKNIIASSSSSELIQKAVDLIFIAKSIERIGDHATNICEDIIFMVHGKDVRHPRANNKM
ncbi:MAG: phosphate signaling complex protein PhoU [Endomicrobium sp.]|jgi:phosphate transport system protein|uniref:phosphate signaling complex protein PhoU n=1 Tax=Candidatus Endomicrobiellum cubanum TaxID=3242325 RepID=UPI002821482C|nr:phosphate signaling complex protein PhoU [Endomicrobium sp.]MDR2395222.1 phosphate signaling complex protein PhoU [Endomicrobium sp.]